MLIIALIGGIGSALYGGYKYIEKMNDQIVTQAETIAEQKLILQSVQDTLELSQQNIKEMMENLDKLDVALSEANDTSEQLQLLLSEHDLTNLAYERPGLIERRIDDATDKILDDFRRLTDPARVRATDE